MQDRSWKLENAQSIADDYPYTFHKPSKKVISLLKKGDEVKLIFEFESNDPEGPRAERMWVEIKSIENSRFNGTLDNDPEYIKDLKYGDSIYFRECHIIATDIDDPVPSITDKYIKRCFVTNRILYDGDNVGYFYREDPDKEDDSGWRIMAGDESEEYMNNSENINYVSLGAVLREDDSILNYLEQQVGARFEKNASGKFVECE